MKCTEYKDKTLMKYEADKAKENGADSYDAVEVTMKKRKVERSMGKSGINYDFQHSGWSSDDSEESQLY